MNFTMEMMNNLADGLFWFLVPSTIFGLILGLTSFFNRSDHNFGSVEYANCSWRIMAVTQLVLGGWFIWLVVNAVPTPDYIYKDKIISKPVPMTSVENYKNVFYDCMRYKSRNVNSCEQIALITINPKKVLKVTTYKVDPYRDLFNTCMGQDIIKGGWGVDHETLRNERIKICHSQAMEIRG